MKISWGKGIVVSIVIFVLITAALVVVSFMQRIDLVANNYYEKEIKYQEQIETMKNTARLNNPVKVTQDVHSVVVAFNDSLDFSKIMGTVKFYRPSNEQKDFSIPLKVENNGKMSVSSDSIEKGFWKIQLNWSVDGNKYFNEVSIILQ